MPGTLFEIRQVPGRGGDTGWHRVTRTVDPGLDPLDETGVPVPAGVITARDATRRPGMPGNPVPRRQGGRGLSHPQDGPLTTAGAVELQSGPGPCGQLRSRTADRMAVPASPSIRERA